MTDLTKKFRALIQAQRVSSTLNANIVKPTKRVEHISTRFLSQAKGILNDLMKLQRFLIESRTNYLSPVYLLPTIKRASDETQNSQYEKEVERQFAQIREQLETLKSSIGHISFSGQRRSHYELVSAYLERELVKCTKIYSEQKCLRYKRESERQKIGRLDHDDQEILTRFSIQTRKPTCNSIEKSTTNPSSIKDVNIEESSSSSQQLTKTTGVVSNNDNLMDFEEEKQIPSPSPTGKELQQLQMENKMLYEDVAQRSNEIHEITDTVADIAYIQNELFNNILNQKDQTSQIDILAQASNDDLAGAIIHIRDAIKNAAQMRQWVIFFLLVMIFSLIFLDWYNV